MEIRLSLGSATQLGLNQMRMESSPTTLYSLVGQQCAGTCAFCTQASDNKANRKLLSRVIWPNFDLDIVKQKLVGNTGIQRICVQTLLDPSIFDLLPGIIEQLHENNNIPISVCMNPVNREYLRGLRTAGVERVGTGLDCATPLTFSKIKPGFSWQRYQQFITDTVDIFGKGSVHLIVGLGDTDEQLIRAFQKYTDMQCSIGLFALTPVRGTKLKALSPPLVRYRALQCARYLISTQQSHVDEMQFMDGKLVSMPMPAEIFHKIMNTGLPFRTSGCPDCNRPNYNERPGGITYNYAKPLTHDEITQAINEVNEYLHL